MIRGHLAPIVLGLALAAPPASAQRPRSEGLVTRETVEPEPGEPGSLPPRVEPASAPALVHQDRGGRGPRVPLTVTAAEGAGFGVAWRDTRHGSEELFLALLAPDGTPRGPERPFAEHGSSDAELRPSLSLNAGGEVALAWQRARPGALPGFLLRLARHDGTFRGPAVWMPVPEDRTPSPRDLRRHSSGPEAGLRTALVVDDEGDAHCAWAFDGLLYLRELRADGELGDLGLIESAGPPAVGAPFLEGSPTGPELCVWNTEEGVCLRRLGHRPTPARGVGQGRALRVVSAREGGRDLGWWILVDLADRIVLRKVQTSGERGGPDVVLYQAPWGRVDLASWSDGLLVLRQPVGEAGRDGFAGESFALRFLSADGSPEERPPVEVACGGDETLIQPMVAAAGERALAVWGRDTGRLTDVVALAIDARDGALGPPARLNTDEASSDQIRVRAAAAAGDRAVLVWEDHRDGRPRAFARVIASGGEPATDELSLAKGTAPCAAMEPGGGFAAVWGGGAGVLRGRTFDANAEPLGERVDLGQEIDLDGGYRVVHQGSHRCWLAAWVSPEGIVVRRIARDGAPLLEPRLAIPVAGASAPSLAELDDGRVVVVGETGPRGARQLRGAFLTSELEPDGAVFALPASWHGHDTAPEVAPGDPGVPGGFLVAWVAGEEGRRDLLCLLVGPDGQPAARARAIGTLLGDQRGPSLVRMQDGSWVVAWEDDLSGSDHAYLRRVFAGGEVLGPVRMLSQRTTAHRVSGHAPSLAVVESGLLGAWVDAQRGQGLDAWYRVIGAGFDRH